MEILVYPDARTASASAAGRMADVVRQKPCAVLGLATGSTPLTLYHHLVAMHRTGGLDFSGVTTFNLDEYVGLAPEHPASYRYFMEENLFSLVNIDRSRTHIPRGDCPGDGVPAACEAYEREIREAGGIDIQLLGIGGDGHIGFNEPSSSLASRTRIKTLTEHTRQANARFFSSMDEVPRHVVTMGIGTILEAREILLLAFGEGKADAVARMVEGPVTANVPASILQMHPVVKVVIDEAAASKLERLAYYKAVHQHKPVWQRWDIPPMGS